MKKDSKVLFEEFKNCKRYSIEELRANNYEQIKQLNSNIVYFVEVPDNFEVEILNRTTGPKVTNAWKTNESLHKDPLSNVHRLCYSYTYIKEVKRGQFLYIFSLFKSSCRYAFHNSLRHEEIDE